MRRHLLSMLAVCGLFCSVASAEDTYFRVRLTDLKFADGELPDYSRINDLDWLTQQRIRSVDAVVQLDQPGEAFLQTGNSWRGIYQWSRQDDDAPIHLAIRSSAKDVSGRLVVPKADGSGLVALKFRIQTESSAAAARREFAFAKIEHYERRLMGNDPGAAWYRHQLESSRKLLGELSDQERQKLQQISARRWTNEWRWDEEFDRTYELFSGGRAVSENLQLDRQLLFPRGNANEAKPVELASIAGITVKEIDWKPLLNEAKPELDPLASAIPADQHVVFFPTFASLLKVSDEAKLQGTAVLRHTELASQDTHLVERYEQQLGLSLSVLGRLIGPKVVSSVAITGSDPYFATGTDVAVLFETKQPSVLAALLLAKIRLDAATVADAKPIEGTADGLKYAGVRSPDRRVCSYVLELPNAVVVTNSVAQLQRLAAISATGRQPIIAAMPEYLFFRQRYKLGDPSESAMLFISDATIRRWCGPRWRIASSRRTRDAAVLTHWQAEHLDALVSGKDLKLGPINSDWPTSQPADPQLTATGVVSPTLGRPDFQTPIAELVFDHVTVAERDAYQRWRDGYQSNWSGAFDPIALRVGTDDKRLLADLSIMPLIAGSQYRSMVQVVSGVKLTAESGDPHDTLAHFVMAINRESPPIQMANQFLAGIMAGQAGPLGAAKPLDPLGWLGKSVAVYADRDPYWAELLKLDPHERQLKIQRDGFRLPVAIRIEVAQPLKLALFLTSLRAYIQQTGPGLTKWESLNHREQTYVKVSSARRGATGVEELDNAVLFYATVGDGLILTPNEEVLKRAIDRQLARDEKPADKKSDAPSDADSPWLGESVAVSFEQLLPSFFAWIFESDVRQMAQAAQIRSWNNLPILNEWKRRYPDRDPVELHAKFWNVELICPGGGKYVWNERWHTMESTVFGHPGEPKMPELSKAAEPDSFKPGLFPFTRARFGLTFEHDGLRSRLELQREAK